MLSPSRIFYPWISLLFAIIIIAWQILVSNHNLIDSYLIPEPLLRQDYFIFACSIGLMLIIYDMVRFLRARRHYDDRLIKYESQISDLFNAKRELGTRAVTYSDHADKLKMFISDRLLEYIEYDEKFLHFKNIASEVRHNGVISYDKVQTALKFAIESAPNSQHRCYQEAGDSLVYLWDLLDLSTTDNIALHIANRIYDCEETYFQSLLKKSTNEDEPPVTPTFTLRDALHRALLPIVENPDELSRAFGDVTTSGAELNYQDKQFDVCVIEDSEMLGNPNHIVLLIENLINNALFYAEKSNTKNRYARVAIHLSQQAGQAELSVYNRGPHIVDADRAQIFQLGYSTRRVREQHGKGLGLYFVNEIIKGFEGSVEFNNIENQEDSISLRFELKNGEIQTHLLKTLLVGNKLQCTLTQSSDRPVNRLDWSLTEPVASMEVTVQSIEQTQSIQDIHSDNKIDYLDSSDRQLPRWVLNASNHSKSAKIGFKTLDVRGVQFVVKLPTAASRLDNQD
ncbi:MAG: signal transduction histidine kinase [Gammaproteobacteria bacterium]|jgi:signal transduction histidine kinase